MNGDDILIINKTQKKMISQDEIVCTNQFSQSLGLMFRKRQNLIMLFDRERKVSLHNFFVFFSLDLLIVDSEMKIVEIKRNFRPFTFWNSSRKGKYLVELGFKGEYAVGDEMEIKV